MEDPRRTKIGAPATQRQRGGPSGPVRHPELKLNITA